MTTSTSTTEQSLSEEEVSEKLTLFQIAPGKQVSHAVLRDLLPDVETALFFGKVYRLNARKLSILLTVLFRTSLTEALLNQGHQHSTELQDYLIEVAPEDIKVQLESRGADAGAPVPDTELLRQAFEAAMTEVADSILKVADTLGTVLDRLPSKYGQMTFQHLHRLNRQRNAIGTYEPVITREAVAPRLVVLDVSGSMTETTVRTIVDEVVGLAYAVHASLAIVSDNAFLWEPGEYTVDRVLERAEYRGTHYEQLLPVFHRDWETVVTIADYDSAASARDFLRQHASGRVGTVLDISLVNRPTFLAECVGQIAQEVKPLLISNSNDVLR